MTLLTPASDTATANWVIEGILGFGESVNSVVPAGFAAYVQLFHPGYRGTHDDLTPVRWTEIAAAMRTHAHPGMQLCALVGVHRYIHHAHPGAFDEAPEQGSLPPELVEPLAAVLSRHTKASDRCWFGVWHGFGGLREDVRSAPEFELPQRVYHLLKGPIDAVTESIDELSWTRRRSANLWWPDDHAWCVATEIDFNSTYIGCDEACRDEILAVPEFEALAIAPSTGITCASDLLNPTPRDGDDD